MSGYDGRGAILYGYDGNPLAFSLPADVAATARGLQINAQNQKYNGATWDLERNNDVSILLALAARTSTTVTATQTNFNNSGGVFTLRISVNPGGAETLTIQVAPVDQLSGNGGFNFASFVLPAATNGVFTFQIHPGVSDALGTPISNGKLAACLPYQYVVTVAHSAGGSWTYSLLRHHIR